MTEAGKSTTHVLAAIQRLLCTAGADVRLKFSFFEVAYAGDSGRLTLHVYPSLDEARERFAANGGRFFEPHGTAYVTAPDGTITGWSPPPPKPPILSTESVAGIGDDNRVWRGYGRNARGVIKMRVGRFLADINAPTVADAEALARQVSVALRG